LGRIEPMLDDARKHFSGIEMERSTVEQAT
jgi:hypothetical protein